MTAIVGVEYNGHVFIGGDRRITYNLKYTMNIPKVFRIGPIIIGSCGDYSSIQRIQNHLRKVFTEQTPTSMSLIAEIMHKYLQDSKDEGQGHLIGFAHQLYRVSPNGSYVQQEAWAIGSGGEVATGVLHLNAHLLPVPRLRLALETAAQFRADVGPPFDVICL